MKIEYILDVYGTNADYYDPVSGYIYHITNRKFDGKVTHIPVSHNGVIFGEVKLNGEY